MTYGMSCPHPFNNVKTYVPLTAVGALMTLVDFTLSNGRRFYSSWDPLGSERVKNYARSCKALLINTKCFFLRMYQLEKHIFENIYPENLIDWTMHNFQQPPDPNYSPSDRPSDNPLWITIPFKDQNVR